VKSKTSRWARAVALRDATNTKREPTVNCKECGKPLERGHSFEFCSKECWKKNFRAIKKAKLHIFARKRNRH